MKSTIFAIASASLLSACVSTQHEPAPDPAQSAQAFEMLKSLAGRWHGSSKSGEQTTPVDVSYEDVSGGSAVMERLHVGSPHEMISMYHMDRDRLLMTHYCSQGNQPRMELDSFTKSPETMASFSFRDATNWKSPNELVMHNVRLYPIGKDQLGADWVAWVNGKPDHTANFLFSRTRSLGR